MKSFDTTQGQKPSECKTLTDACTPLVYRHNSFRITGLSVHASTRDIKRRIDDLKHAQELGEADNELTHAFALQPTPTIDIIRDAAQRLHDPERRIIEEFFWFWPDHQHDDRSDPALTALVAGDKDTAFKIWSAALSDDDASSVVVAKHNLAVMYQLVALDSEHFALESDLTPDQLQTIAKYWRTCFKWWEELTDSETFWSLVSDRIRLLDDPRLTTGFARRMRTTLPEALDKINAMLAMQFIERDKLDLAAAHITYMRETHQGLDDVPRTLAHVTKPLRSRISSAVEKASTTATQNPAIADRAALDLVDTAREPLRILALILPQDDQEGIDISESVAAACLECATSFAHATDRWDAALEILEKAEPFARTPDTRIQFASAKSDAQSRKELSHPNVKELLTMLQSIESLERLAKIKEIYHKAPPLLAAIASSCGKTSKAYSFSADAVAAKLRNLAVEIHNNVTESTPPAIGMKLLALSLEIHDQAASIACGQELKASFREDEAALREFRSALASRGATSSIRTTLINEGLLPLWGRSTSVAPAKTPPPVPTTANSSNNTGCVVMAVIGVIVFLIWASSQGSSSKSTRPSSSSSGTRTAPYSQGTRSSTRSSSQNALEQQINSGKSRASTIESQLDGMDRQLDNLKQRMNSYNRLGMIDEYNSLVPQFNSLVNRRNQLYQEYSRVIDDVNAKVKRYNAGY